MDFVIEAVPEKMAIKQAVFAELEEGQQIGIQGTPAFLINGHSMSGAQPYTIFEQAIEQFLAETG